MAAIADPNGAGAEGASGLVADVRRHAPGLALAVAIAICAYGLRIVPGLSGLSPMIIAIALGIAFGNLAGLRSAARPGVAFAMRRVLRFAIVTLGLQLTISQVVEVGAGGLATIVASLVATFLFTTWVGRRLGVEARLAQLIAGGTSICGASAIVAVNTVTRGSDEDVAYAVACVTLFGTIAMIVYPLLPAALGLDPLAYGLWSGASIHEVAQVAGAGFANGQASGEFGTMAKLARVMMLAPVVIALGLLAARAVPGGTSARASAPMPWFVLGFVALVALNSAIDLPAVVETAAAPLTTFLLTVALAAMGLVTNVGELRSKGCRPLLLGLASFLFIASFSLVCVKLFA